MVYIVSDIHGEYDLFIKLLQKINFSSDDEMIICGDIIDKGKHSVKLLQFIRSKPNFYCIVGNHEYALLKRYWAIMESSPTDFEEVLKELQTYFDNKDNLLCWEDIDWLESLPFYIERDKFICVHAGLSLSADGQVLPLSKTQRERLVYDREFKEPSVIPIIDKCVFFGHTPTSYIANDAKIIKYTRQKGKQNSICDYYKIHLDLGVWLYGTLGCFCIDDCKEYYVSK